jgi:ComF family protein
LHDRWFVQGHWINAAATWLLEPRCAACKVVLDAPLDGPVCGRCWHQIARVRPPFCHRCGDRLPADADDLCSRCSAHAPPFDLARSAAEFDGTVRELIHAFKYERRRGLAPALASLMRERAHDVLAGADAVVPVPLHPFRSLSRGFNQADDLARLLGLPVWRILRRRRWRTAQATLGASARHHNLSGAFEARGSWVRSGRRRARLARAIVVIVDDVITTGATIEVCATELQALGVRSVRALTVARAVQSHPPPPPRPRPPSDPRHR